MTDSDVNDDLGDRGHLESPHALLNILAALAGQGAAEVDVSLLVGGKWVTGTMTSPAQYVSDVRSVVRRATGETAAAFVEGWETAFAERGDDDLKFVDSDVIYLRNAAGWADDGTHFEAGPVSVRGDSVHAFIVGRMSPNHG